MSEAIEAAEEAGPRDNWVWRAVVLAALTLMVPGVAYPGLFILLAKPWSGLPNHLAELIAASAALVLSLLTFKVYNGKESLGLDIGGLFSVRPFRRTAAVFSVLVLADLALIGAFVAVMQKYYPDHEGSSVILRLWADNDKWFFVFVNTAIYATCEEIFLRGLVFTYVKKHAGFLKALLASSILFSLMHGGRIWVGLLVIFFDGIIYALAFEKTRSLAVPSLLHGLHNFVLRTFILLEIF